MPVAVLGHHGNAIIHGVKFGLLPLAVAHWRRLRPSDRQPHTLAVFAPFKVVRAFGVSFLFAVDHDHIRLDAAIGGKGHRAVSRPLAGLDSFGKVDFGCSASVTLLIQLGISVGITGSQVLDNEGNGGEGGIRTPDTLSGMPVFKTGAINHSATSPESTSFTAAGRFCQRINRILILIYMRR